jgi:hypothetical protein
MGDSTSTLLIDEESDEETDDYKNIQTQTFMANIEIKRAERYKKQHQERGRTIQNIDSLYKKIYRVTRIQAYVERVTCKEL